MNAQRVTKASHQVVPGDVLTFPQADRVRVIKITAIGLRRGPAPEAQALYLDQTPALPEAEGETAGHKLRIGARPTKKTRRAYERLRDGFKEP